jgi:hypothetical protein
VLARRETPCREDPDSGCCQPRHRSRRAPGLLADRIITFAEIVGKKTSSPTPTAAWVAASIRMTKLRALRDDREQEVVELNSKVPVREQERPSVKKLLAYEKEVNTGFFAKTA